jgi:hypothetical protein
LIVGLVIGIIVLGELAGRIETATSSTDSL